MRRSAHTALVSHATDSVAPPHCCPRMRRKGERGLWTAAETCPNGRTHRGDWYGVGREWETLLDWNEPVGDAPEPAWGQRSGFGWGVLGGKIYVMGGEMRSLKNDVWSSSNGTSWDLLHPTAVQRDGSAAWEPRTRFLHTVHEVGGVHYLYVFSGVGCGGYCNDVWRAPAPAPDSQKLEFEKMGDTATKRGRERGLALSFSGRLYDIGGVNPAVFIDIHMSEDGGRTWQEVEIVEPACTAENGVCSWTDDIVGAWPTSEYRIVGTGHLDAIYIFGGRSSSPGDGVSVLRLKSVGDGRQMELHREVGTIGSGQIQRAYALSFLSTLWFATGLEDLSGSGSNELYYLRDDGQWAKQDDVSEESSKMRGRLHGGFASFFAGDAVTNATTVLNRICLFLGDRNGVAARWRISCSKRMIFPEPCLQHMGENVGKSGVTLRAEDPVEIRFTHAKIPAGCRYHVKYYAGAFDPDQHTDYYTQNVVVLPGSDTCAYLFQYQRNPVGNLHQLFLNAKVVFEDNQVFLDTTKTENSWLVKFTLPPPSATSAILKTAAGGNSNLYHITVSCNDEDTGTPRTSCERGGTCKIAYSYAPVDSDTILRDVVICDTNPCDIVIEDLVRREAWAQGSAQGYTPQLLDVHARCTDSSGTYLESSWVKFPAPIIARTTSYNDHSATSAPLQVMTTPTPTPARLFKFNYSSVRGFVGQTTKSTKMVLRGENMDLIDVVHVGRQVCIRTDSQNPGEEYSCLVPAGLGVVDLRIEWKIFGGAKVSTSTSTYQNAIKYPLPVTSIDAGLLSTKGGSTVIVHGAYPKDVVDIDFVAAATIGDSSATGVRWVSESSLTLVASGGVGNNHRIILSVQGTSQSLDTLFSYQAPQISSIKSSIGPGDGGVKITVFGSSFGSHASTLLTYIGSSHCKLTTWVSDSNLICVSPAGFSDRKDLPVSVAVAQQSSVSSGRYQYTSGTDLIEIFLSQSPEDLRNVIETGDSRRTRLDAFKIWLTATLGLKEAGQVYIHALEPSFRRTARRKCRLFLRIFASPKDSRTLSAILEAFEFLVRKSIGGFDGSGVTVEAIRLRPQAELISVAPASAKTSLDAAGSKATKGPEEAGGVSLSVILSVVATIVGMVFACCMIHFKRRSSRASIRDSEISSRPNAIALHAEASSDSAMVRGVVLRPDAVQLGFFGPKKAPLSKINSGMCEQCYNSGFSTCVHQNMGLIDNTQEDSQEEVELCVVCMENNREALVVHADEAKTSHQVLCLACAYKVIAFVRLGACKPVPLMVCRLPASVLP